MTELTVARREYLRTAGMELDGGFCRDGLIVDRLVADICGKWLNINRFLRRG